MRQRILLFLLSVAFAFTGFRYAERFYPKVTADCGVVLLNDDSSFRFYSVTDSNRMVCDLSTISLIVRNMIDDGFITYREVSTEDSLDIILQRDGLNIRMYYETDGRFTSIADAYEKSYLPFTYINEEDIN